MEFKNETLEKMQNKKQINILYSKYLYRMFKESGGNTRLKNRSERTHDCLNLWVWDQYRENKILDLQRVNRCMDNRFCPNCRKFSLASAIHNFSPSFKQLIDEGYNPYLLTLTIPNVPGGELRDTIKKMNLTFRKFFQKLSQPVITGYKGFSERQIEFDAALKVLEITYNKKENNYHPHFHCIVFSKKYDEILLKKYIPGPWSNRLNRQIYFSDLDVHLSKLWKMLYDNVKVTKKTFNNYSDDWFELYMCDIREMDVNGIYEVMKYTFKDSDIQNYDVFKNMFIALDGQRIRQGHGLLYNLKVEEEADGEKQDIEVFLIKKENPEQLFTREINSLITVYKDYRKISRFNSANEINNLD